MRPEKKRIDTSGERIVLTDNPFAQLAAARANLPVSDAVTAPTTPEKRVPRPAPDAVSPPKAAAKHAEFDVERTRKGGYNLAIEKRSGGKVVTVVRGISRGAEPLLAKMKKLCGAGGALREDGIEIQGDHRDRIERFLREKST